MSAHPVSRSVPPLAAARTFQKQSFDLAEPPAVVRVRVRGGVIRVRIHDPRVRIRVVARTANHTAPWDFPPFFSLRFLLSFNVHSFGVLQGAACKSRPRATLFSSGLLRSLSLRRSRAARRRPCTSSWRRNSCPNTRPPRTHAR